MFALRPIWANIDAETAETFTKKSLPPIGVVVAELGSEPHIPRLRRVESDSCESSYRACFDALSAFTTAVRVWVPRLDRSVGEHSRQSNPWTAAGRNQ